MLLPMGCHASSVTSVVADLPGATSPTRALQAQITQRCTRSVAMHPLRRDTPDRKGCNAYGSGAPTPTTSTTAGFSSRHTQPATSDTAIHPQNARSSSAREALHQLGSITPVREHYTTSELVQYPAKWCNTTEQQVPVWRYASTPRRNARQRSSAATKETTHDRETQAGHNTTHCSGGKLMRDAVTRFGRSHRRRHRAHFSFIERHGTSMTFGFTTSIALIRGWHIGKVTCGNR